MKTAASIPAIRIKKIFKIIFVFLLVLAVLILFTKNPVADPKRLEHQLQVSDENLKAHVLKISGWAARNPENIQILNQTADYIQQQWIEQGYTVKEQKYKITNQYKEEVEVKNLIVTYNDQGDPSQNTIVVGAHYDVWSALPGADDNASGVAGLLELTRLIKQQSPLLTSRIEFVAYTLEEPPFFDTDLMGSFVHARSLKENNRKVSLMLSLEMIGYFSELPNSQNYPVPFLNNIYSDKGNFIALVGEFGEWFITRKAKTYFQQLTDLPVFSINTTKYMEGIDWSDHLSYWKQGYPALMVTDTSFLRNTNYHKAADTADLLDYKKSAQVVLGVYGIITNF